MRARLVVLSFWLLGFMLAVAAGAEEVSLNRLVVRVNTNTTSLAAVDVGLTTRFCGDADGCKIVVRLEGATEARTKTARLFTNAGVANRWFSSDTEGLYFMDGDDAYAKLAWRLDLAATACFMDDGEVGLDEYPGFEISVAGEGATCTVVISD